MSEYADQPKAPIGLPVVSEETIEALATNSSENPDSVKLLGVISSEQPALVGAIADFIRLNSRNNNDKSKMLVSALSVYQSLRQQAAANELQAQLEPTDMPTSLPLVSEATVDKLEEEMNTVAPEAILDKMQSSQPHLAEAITDFAASRAADGVQLRLLTGIGVYTYWLLEAEAASQEFEQEFPTVEPGNDAS